MNSEWPAGPASMRTMLTTVEPPNIRAIVADHGYAACTLEEVFLMAHRVTKIKQEEMQQIEQASRDQAATSLWFQTRAMPITSSKFHEVSRLRTESTKMKPVR